jgi:Cu(I)/Ag(I) efflux system membrane fusion protein
MRRNRILLGVAAVLALGAAFAAGALFFGHRHTGTPSPDRRILYYRSPMNPQVTSPTPKKDPMGMDFVPVYADQAENQGAPAAPDAGPHAVHIEARVIQETGVTTQKAERRIVNRTVRTVGVVQPDERRLHSVTVKFAGWVEQLYVNFTGDRVRKGARLATIYSPELLATQREYLLALRYARSVGQRASPDIRTEADNLLQSARRRLLLWDISERQIEELTRRGKPTRSMTIHAPADGVVLEKSITAGVQVQPGMTLLRIADLRDVWVFAQIYPYQLPWLRKGQVAQIQLSGIPGRSLQGRVNYIQPVVSPEARTVEVRIEVAQPGDAIVLKPNMYADVEIQSPVQQEAVAIPEQSIIRSGERNVGIVALGNGYFEPRDLKLGAAGGGYVEILDGIRAGEEVVTSAQFLLDSESNLRTALGAMGAIRGHGAGIPESDHGSRVPPAPQGDPGHSH